ncbi:5461_t:CDS:2, partial [Funneliformis caledonium]
QLEKETNEILEELANYVKKERNTQFLNRRKLSEAKTALRFNEQDFNDRMEKMVNLKISLEVQESKLEKSGKA